MSQDDNIARLRAKSRREELRRINRLTGLNFDSVPESLINRPQDEWETFTRSLLGEAMTVWGADPQQADG